MIQPDDDTGGPMTSQTTRDQVLDLIDRRALRLQNDGHPKRARELWLTRSVVANEWPVNFAPTEAQAIRREALLARARIDRDRARDEAESLRDDLRRERATLAIRDRAVEALVTQLRDRDDVVDAEITIEPEPIVGEIYRDAFGQVLRRYHDAGDGLAWGPDALNHPNRTDEHMIRPLVHQPRRSMDHRGDNVPDCPKCARRRYQRAVLATEDQVQREARAELLRWLDNDAAPLTRQAIQACVATGIGDVSTLRDLLTATRR